MTLDAAYLEYPKRREGMDHDLYPASNLFTRPPVAWPDGKGVAVAILVNLEWFPILPSDTPFRAPGHMQTPYPDYRHYTAREYGARVGFYRLLDAFANHLSTFHTIHLGQRVRLVAHQQVTELADVVEILAAARAIEAGHTVPAIAALGVNGLVGRNRVEPGPESALRLELLALQVDLQKSRLENVLRQFRIP